MSAKPSRRQTIKSTRAAMRSALKAMEEIQQDGWTIRDECAAADCVVCPRKKAARTRALAAMNLLRRELNEPVAKVTP